MVIINWDEAIQNRYQDNFNSKIDLLKLGLEQALKDLGRKGLSVEIITPQDKIKELLEEIKMAESEPLDSPFYVNPENIWEEHDTLVEVLTEMKERNEVPILLKFYAVDGSIIREGVKLVECLLREAYPTCKLDVNNLEFTIDSQGGLYKKYLTLTFVNHD